MQCSSKPPVLLLHPAGRSVPIKWLLTWIYQFCNVSTPPVFSNRLVSALSPGISIGCNNKIFRTDTDCIRSYNLYCFKVFIDEIAARARLTGRYSSELACCSLDSHPF